MTNEVPQSESTLLKPETPYAISKVAGLHLCRYYRNVHGIFSAVGILYNHESPRRGPSFITTQIANAAAVASLGRPVSLKIRDLDAVVDWGDAKDYVEAMWLMLQQESPYELIIATGIPHTINEFAQAAFNTVGLHAKDYLTLDPSIKKTSQVPYVGDNKRLKQICGWQPRTSFEHLVNDMVMEHITRESRRKNPQGQMGATP